MFLVFRLKCQLNLWTWTSSKNWPRKSFLKCTMISSQEDPRTRTRSNRTWKRFKESGKFSSANLESEITLTFECHIVFSYVLLLSCGLFRLRPRVLVDVSRIDMATTVLGYKISAPIMVAPTSRHQLAHPEGLNSIDQILKFCNS